MKNFLTKSIILTIIILGLTLGGFLNLNRLDAKIMGQDQKLAQLNNDAQSENEYQNWRKNLIDPILTAQNVFPDESDLAGFYNSLEALAKKNQVELRYDFGEVAESDAILTQAKNALDQWVIPVDFLGEKQSLETIFKELETGPYLVRVHAYRFDITDSKSSLLSTTLILYGRN